MPQSFLVLLWANGVRAHLVISEPLFQLLHRPAEGGAGGFDPADSRHYPTVRCVAQSLGHVGRAIAVPSPSRKRRHCTQGIVVPPPGWPTRGRRSEPLGHRLDDPLERGAGTQCLQRRHRLIRRAPGNRRPESGWYREAEPILAAAGRSPCGKLSCGASQPPGLGLLWGPGQDI